MKVVSVRNAVRYGISSTWTHLGFLTKASLVCFFASIGVGLLIVLANLPLALTVLESLGQEGMITINSETITMWGSWMLSQSAWWLYAIILVLSSLAISFFSTYLVFGFACALLELYDHGRSSIKTLFQPFHLGLIAFGATILFSLGSMIGFALLFIPGVIFILLFGFYLFAISDYKCGVIDSFKLSYEVTKGARLRLLLIGVALFVLNFVLNAFFSLGILLLTAAPFAKILLMLIAMLTRFYLYFVNALTLVYAYRTLQTQTNLPAVPVE